LPEAGRRARLIGIVALATALADWALKALARASADGLVAPNPEPFALVASLQTWLPILLCAALLCAFAGVNRLMLVAFGLGVGGGLANEIESRVLGEVTDFLRPGLLRDAVYAPADLAMYGSAALMIAGIGLWIANGVGGRAEAPGRAPNR
jgi:hypothetical protein